MLQPRVAGAKKKVKAGTAERPEDIIRRLQRLSFNKRCADCTGKLPQFVNLTHGTFVCTTCSGIHREFSHRIKGTAHSSFTSEEAQELSQNGGNEAVNSMYLAKYDEAARIRIQAPSDPSDQQLLRVWIRRKYLDKAWYYCSSDDESKQQQHATRVVIPSTTTSFPQSNQKEQKKEEDLFGGDWPEPSSASNNSWNAFGDSNGSNNNSNIAFEANFSQQQQQLPTASDTVFVQKDDFASFPSRSQHFDQSNNNNFASFSSNTESQTIHNSQNSTVDYNSINSGAGANINGGSQTLQIDQFDSQEQQLQSSNMIVDPMTSTNNDQLQVMNDNYQQDDRNQSRFHANFDGMMNSSTPARNQSTQQTISDVTNPPQPSGSIPGVDFNSNNNNLYQSNMNQQMLQQMMMMGSINPQFDPNTFAAMFQLMQQQQQMVNNNMFQNQQNLGIDASKLNSGSGSGYEQMPASIVDQGEGASAQRNNNNQVELKGGSIDGNHKNSIDKIILQESPPNSNNDIVSFAPSEDTSVKNLEVPTNGLVSGTPKAVNETNLSSEPEPSSSNGIHGEMFINIADDDMDDAFAGLALDSGVQSQNIGEQATITNDNYSADDDFGGSEFVSVSATVHQNNEEPTMNIAHLSTPFADSNPTTQSQGTGDQSKTTKEDDFGGSEFVTASATAHQNEAPKINIVPLSTPAVDSTPTIQPERMGEQSTITKEDDFGGSEFVSASAMSYENDELSTMNMAPVSIPMVDRDSTFQFQKVGEESRISINNDPADDFGGSEFVSASAIASQNNEIPTNNTAPVSISVDESSNSFFLDGDSLQIKNQKVSSTRSGIDTPTTRVVNTFNKDISANSMQESPPQTETVSIPTMSKNTKDTPSMTRAQIQNEGISSTLHPRLRELLDIMKTFNDEQLDQLKMYMMFLQQTSHTPTSTMQQQNIVKSNSQSTISISSQRSNTYVQGEGSSNSMTSLTASSEVPVQSSTHMNSSSNSNHPAQQKKGNPFDNF